MNDKRSPQKERVLIKLIDLYVLTCGKLDKPIDSLVTELSKELKNHHN